VTQSNYSPNSYPQPTTKRRVDSGGPDFYPTPRWATQALVDHESFEGTVWEPACGDGAMSDVLKESGLSVMSSDLYDRGYHNCLAIDGVDFLKSNSVYDNIITNPPYSLANDFVIHALNQSRKKVAFLLRLSFLEGATRQKNIFQRTPPTRIWIFSERVTFYPKGEERSSGGTTAYAWFVWDRSHVGSPEIKWISLGRKPGSRKGYRSPLGAKLTLSDLRLSPSQK